MAVSKVSAISLRLCRKACGAPIGVRRFVPTAATLYLPLVMKNAGP
jgi:hypothetical protein